MQDNIELKKINYVEPTIPASIPDVPQELYQNRIEQVWEKMKDNGITHLIVYGDREHFANLRFLTGYDPRFEEGLLILSISEKPTLLVGNEGMDYVKITPVDLNIELYPHFSLQGQPRNNQKSLLDIFIEHGIKNDSTIGIVGYKYMESEEFGDPNYVTDVPSYIVDTLRSLSNEDKVFDVTRWFTDSSSGFRIPATVDEIARYEATALYLYAGMKRALESLEVGVTEIEVTSKLGYNGVVPLSYHLAVGFGENAELGLGSPTNRKLQLEDFITLGFGMWGSNIARTGIAVADASQLSKNISDALEKVYIPYFKGLLQWYKCLKVGVSGREVYNSVAFLVEDPFFSIKLNPGHLIREEEWINAPFSPQSKDILPSGTVIQCDIIVAATPPYSGIHTEDGLVIADKSLRNELALKYPDMWKRVLRRRKAMADLGYELHEDVLPLSDMQGFVTPFLLAPDLALAVK